MRDIIDIKKNRNLEKRRNYQNYPIPDPSPNSTYNPAPASPSPKNKKKSRKIINFSLFLVFTILIAGGTFLFLNKSKDASKTDLPKTEKQLVHEQLLEKTNLLTLPFIKNAGQKDEQVKFYAPIENGTVYVNESGITYDTKITTEEGENGLAIQEKLIGLDGAPMQLSPEGEAPSEADINYYLGNNKEEWRNNLENYKFINFKEVYPKIEFKVRATEKNIEKLFIVDKEGNPNDIKLNFDGIEKLEVTEQGELKLINQERELVLTAPQAYQYYDGKKKYIAVRYQLEEDNSYGFEVENYDNSKILVIDPMIASTLIGGGEEDRFEFNSSFSAYVGRSNTIQDSSGNVYVVAHTRSADYPTTLGAYDASFNDADPSFGNDLVISKFNPDLTTLISSTYLGGTGEDNGFAIALDASNNVYVSGFTKSTDFPMTSLIGTPYQSSYQGGDYDVVIARLSNDLTTLSASTYLGGTGADHAMTMLINGGALYLAGDTDSANFPITTGTIKTTKEGTVDSFISKLDLNLSALYSSTFFGGNNNDFIKDLDIYNSNLYLTGYTNSDTNFASGTAYSSTYGGGDSDAFVASINTDLTTINQSTYLGGIDLDYAFALDIDATGNVIVTGSSKDSFTVTSGVYDETHNSVGQYDGFVSVLTNNLSDLSASTYIGGNGSDEMYDVIADDVSGDIYVSGFTTSTNYPANNNINGAGDGTITRFNSDLTQLLASTLIGGTANIDKVFGLGITSDGKILASGITDSTDFPTTIGAYQETNLGKRDIFVSKLDNDLIISQTPHHIQLSVDGTATPTIRAGIAETLTFEAKDILNDNLIDYDGDHVFVLSGALAGLDGTEATCDGIPFGDEITLSFVDGVASCSLIATRVYSNPQHFDANESGGTDLDTLASADYDLSPVINPGLINPANSRIETPNDNFSAGADVAVRVAPYDMYLNPLGSLGDEGSPDVDVFVEGSNPINLNNLSYVTSYFQATYTGTIAGHDYVKATINGVLVGRDSDPDSVAPYDGSNGTRNILGFDHLELTVGGSNSISGDVDQTYTLQVWAKNSLGETLTGYNRNVSSTSSGLVFSGASDSPYGFKASCTNRVGAMVDFDSLVKDYTFTNGILTSNMIIKGAQTGTSIDVVFLGTITSEGSPDYDLDLVDITYGAADHLNIRESAQVEYHSDIIDKDAGQTTNINISARDQYGNINPTYTGDHNILFSGATNSYGKSGTGGTIPTVNGDTNAFDSATPSGTGTTLNFTTGESTATMLLYDKDLNEIEVDDGTLNSWSSTYSGMNLNNLDLDINISSTGNIDYTKNEITSQTNPNGTCGEMEILVITRDEYGNQLEGEHSSALNVYLTFDPASTNNPGMTTPLLTNRGDGSFVYSYVAFPGLDTFTGTVDSNSIVSDAYPSTPITGDTGSDGIYLQEMNSGYNKRTWTGEVSSDWDNPANWLEGTTPLYCSYVVIARENYIGTNCSGAVCQPTINFSTGTKEIQGLYLGETVDPFALAPFDIETTPHTYHNVDADGDVNLTMSQASQTNYLKINDDLIIYEKGLITHTANTTTQEHIVNIEVGDDFTSQASDLDASGVVDADEKGEVNLIGKGYKGGEGPGQGEDGFDPGGASYGGKGGYGTNGILAGSVYGNLEEPNDLGSGGGNRSTGIGGSGGGAVKINIGDSATIDGIINVNGGDYIGWRTAGGSGGSVWLTTQKLNGSGTISSNAGASYGTYGGGSGGGRIAVYYSTDTSSINYQSWGSAGHANGGAGTIYKKDINEANGDLIIDNNDQDLEDDRYIGKTPISETIDFRNITIQNYGYFDIRPTANITYASVEWSNKGIIADNGGNFPLVSGGGNLEIPATARLMGNTSRAFTGLIVDGTLTHSNNSTIEEYKLDYTVIGNCVINVGGAVDVVGRGYQEGAGPGAGVGLGSGGSGPGGGSYGGVGGDGDDYPAGPYYGSLLEPIDLGSGGGKTTNDSYIGSAGGGAVKLNISDTITILGSISASGEDHSAYVGGGSGGSIWLNAGTLSGTGTIFANGGSGPSGYQVGGGGGGRIALYYATDLSTITYQAYGGTGWSFGGAGTIYKKEGSSDGNLIIDNNNQSPLNNYSVGKTYLDSVNIFNDIIVENYGYLSTITTTDVTYSNLDWSTTGVIEDNGGIFDLLSGGGNLTVPATSIFYENYIRTHSGYTIDGFMETTVPIDATGDFNIESTGTVTHKYNTTTQLYILEITANNLSIADGGKIDVVGKGYKGGEGPGQGLDATGSGGASYGGKGGNGENAIAGSVYGNLKEPKDLGSGGGNLSTSDPGGSGGGAVKLNIGNLATINGSINVNGNNYVGWRTAGGSGGSVWLTTQTLTGSGTISSNAGASYGTLGGGSGGGRIAIYYSTDTSSINYQSWGGAGYVTGGAGTIYLSDTDNPENNKLIIDNNGQIGPDTPIGYNVTQTEPITVPVSKLYFSTNSKAVIENGVTLDFSLVNSIVNEFASAPTNSYLYNQSGDVIFNPNTAITNFTFIEDSSATLTADNLTIDENAVFEQANYYYTTDDPLLFNTLTINSGGIFTHSQNTSETNPPIHTVYIKVNNLDIQPGGAIDVSGKGWNTNGTYSGTLNSGAGHGGIGGQSTTGTGGAAYESAYTPSFPGSRGFGGSAGGGAARIIVDNSFTNNGDINANALTAAENTGGGSGGSILISAKDLNGSGNLFAKGGDTSGTSGAGSGGRIAVYYENRDDYTGSSPLDTADYEGGIGGNQVGAIGTFYMASADHYQITGANVQEAGTVNPITIYLKDENNNDYIYDGTRPITFSGANLAPDGTNPTCSDNSTSDINFGLPVSLDFASGQANSNMILYEATAPAQAEIDAEDGTFSTAGNTTWDLDVTVNSGVIDKSKTLLDANPNPLDISLSETANITVSTYDTWDNQMTSGGEQVDLSLTGTNGPHTFSTLGTADSLITDNNDGTYSTSFTPTLSSEDLISGTIGTELTNITHDTDYLYLPTKTDDGTYHLLSTDGGASHYQITGTNNQEAGTNQTITIQAKDDSDFTMTDYVGQKTVRLSGAENANTGEAPFCLDYNNNPVQFNQDMILDFNNGEATCQMTLYKDQSPDAHINVTEQGGDSLSSTALLAYGLDVDVSATSSDINQALLSASPNPININEQTTVTISLLVRDQYQNNVTTGTETITADVDLGNNGSIDQDDISLTDPDTDGIYTTTYEVIATGTDLITAQLNSSAVTNDNDGTSDGNLYVDVVTNQYTVEFQDYDGTNLKTEIVNHGESATAPADPTREGYTFTGWDTDFSNVTSSLIVTAQYSINTYTVTFNENGGDTPADPTTKTADYNSTIDALPTAPTRVGYTFQEWNTEADGLGTTFTEATTITDNLTVYAIWNSNNYILTYIAGEGGTITGTTPQTVSHGSDGIEVTATPNTGYHFTDWSDGILTASRTDTNVTGDILVTANFAINTYTVDFEDYDGSNLKTETVNHGEDATPPANPTREGYTFTGWDLPYTNITSNTTITAQYSDNSTINYTVIFQDYDGTNLKTETVSHGSGATPPANPTREGYIFVGWDTDFSNVTSNLIITAVYEINESGGINIPGDPEMEDHDIDEIETTWSKNGNPDSVEYYIKNITTDEDSGWIFDNHWISDDLDCGEKYDFKVKARDENGNETEYSSEVTMETKVCDEDSIEIEKTEQECDSLKLKINLNDHYKGEKIDFKIEIKKIINGEKEVLKIEGATINENGEVLLGISNLKENTEYEIKAKFKSKDNYDYSEWSNTETLTTPICVVSDPIPTTPETPETPIPETPETPTPETPTPETPSKSKSTSTDDEEDVEIGTARNDESPLEKIKGMKAFATQNQTATATASLAGLSLLSLAILSQLPSINYIGALLRSIGSFLTGIFINRRKEDRAWGVVFDDFTGKPVPMAGVSIFDEEKNRKVDSRVTDKYGSYSFLVSPGNYSVKAEKGGYQFNPSVIESNFLYSNQYDGKTLAFDDYDIVKEDIPMKPDKEKYERAKMTFKVKQIFFDILLLSGLIFSFGALFLHQSLINYLICGLYVVSLIVGYFMRGGQKWATIVNEKGAPEPFAIIKVIDKATGERKTRTVTDEKGRCFIILNKGDYEFNVTTVSGEKSNFNVSINNERDIVKGKLKLKESWR